MKKDLVKLVGAVSTSYNRLHGYSKKNLENLFEDANSQYPGIQKAFQKHLQNEKDNAVVKLHNLAIELDYIFAKGNKEACAKCQRGSVGDQPADPRNGCCSGCWGSHGHFEYYSSVIKFRTAIGALMDKYGWNHVYGFWSKQGCVLPREQRSICCLQESCDKLDKYLTQEQRKRHRDIIKEIRRLRVLTLVSLV